MCVCVCVCVLSLHYHTKLPLINAQTTDCTVIMAHDFMPIFAFKVYILFPGKINEAS